MIKRNYKKYTDVYRELEAFCMQSFSSGVSSLPGERELAAYLNTSRLTLRKALENAQRNGLIHRQGKQSEILFHRELKNCGKILFLAPGMHDSFFQPAFERLWLTLKPRVENAGGVIHLYLDNPEREMDEFRRTAEAADLILLTICSGEKVEYLKTLQSRKTILALSDPYLDDFQNVIALDNHAAGALAAKALLAAGCRRCVVTNVALKMNMFSKRWDGFQTYFLAHGGLEAALITRQAEAKKARELLDAFRSGYDGAFVVTDEDMESRTALLFAENCVPERFKLISFNGSGEGMRCTPPVTCVNHGTTELVEEITAYLKRFTRFGAGEKIRKLIPPHLYRNKTIGAVDDNLCIDSIKS